jgi:hypothetical protein
MDDKEKTSSAPVQIQVKTQQTSPPSHSDECQKAWAARELAAGRKKFIDTVGLSWMCGR